jgi:hypothetical protein
MRRQARPERAKPFGFDSGLQISQLVHKNARNNAAERLGELF